RVIPNAVEIDENINGISKDLFLKEFEVTNFIFCVGRIEPLKNQIGVIEALKNTDYKIVFAGKLNNKHKEYCKRFADLVEQNKNLYYVGQLDERMIFSAYKNARVTIIASWFETTGLVGLEAAKMGSNLVITDRGYTKDYYGDYVEYCSPDSSKGILNAVNIAFNKTVDERLIQKLNKEFNWSNTAVLTKQAYDKLMIEVKQY
uniref:glycosyltransferase n=1 Tax=Clostridium sp. TaxID=1506 RepID=UPI002617E24F